MTEKTTPYLDYTLSKCADTLEKQAFGLKGIYNGILNDPEKSEQMAKATKGVLNSALSLAIGAAIPIMTINSWKNKLQNDTRRKAIIEDLYQNDPIIKNADREEVIQYYATIMSIAPSVSLDKNIVRELMQNFVKFGRVDIQTIKTLSETERSISQSKSLPFRITDALHLMG